MKYSKDLLNNFFVASLILICIVCVPIAKAQPALTKALDYDGDGKVDQTLFNPANNTWYIYKSATSDLGTIQYAIAELDTAVPGDYDGDGRGDIAVWRSEERKFYINGVVPIFSGSTDAGALPVASYDTH